MPAGRVQLGTSGISEVCGRDGEFTFLQLLGGAGAGTPHFKIIPLLKAVLGPLVLLLPVLFLV